MGCRGCDLLGWRRSARSMEKGEEKSLQIYEGDYLDGTRGNHR